MNTGKAKRRDMGIWLAVALLVILLLITWTLLAGMLGAHSGKPRDTIALTPEESTKTVYHTLYRPAEVEPDSVTADDEVQWEATTDINLFQSSYTNKDGEVTVKSASGENVIAPGTENLYTFSIRNTGNTALNYSISLDSAFMLSGKEIPMTFRLRRGSEWLAGSETQWCTLEEINSYTGNSALNPEKTDEYLLEWQWAFERSDGSGDSARADQEDTADTADTALSRFAVDANAEFHLEITTVAQMAPDAVAVNGDGELLYEQVIGIREILLFALDLGVLILLILLLLWRKRIYFTGFVSGTSMVGMQMQCGRKKDTIRADGRFVFPGIHTGKYQLRISEDNGSWKFCRKRGIEGIQFAENHEIWMGRGIRAIEIYLIPTAEGLQPDIQRWAAVDNRNNVYTPAGIREPEEDGSNVTPGGLHVSRRGRYSFPEQDNR